MTPRTFFGVQGLKRVYGSMPSEGCIDEFAGRKALPD
jgi:hypothetical protein